MRVLLWRRLKNISVFFKHLSAFLLAVSVVFDILKIRLFIFVILWFFCLWYFKKWMKLSVHHLFPVLLFFFLFYFVFFCVCCFYIHNKCLCLLYLYLSICLFVVTTMCKQQHCWNLRTFIIHCRCSL